MRHSRTDVHDLPSDRTNAMPMIPRSFALVLLAVLCVAGFDADSLRGEEPAPMTGLTVEIWWASDETFPVDRMILASANRIDEANAWRVERNHPLTSLSGIPGLEDLIADGNDALQPSRYRQVVVLNAAECSALYSALQKQPPSDRKSHYGYDALIRLGEDATRRKLGSRAETCKFLREVSAEMEPETATAISVFTRSVDRMPGGALSPR